MSKAKVTIKPQYYDAYKSGWYYPRPNIDDITVTYGSGKNMITLDKDDYYVETTDLSGKNWKIRLKPVILDCFNGKDVTISLKARNLTGK